MKRLYFLFVASALVTSLSVRAHDLGCSWLLARVGQTRLNGVGDYIPSPSEVQWLPKEFQASGEVLKLLEESPAFRRVALVYLHSLGTASFTLKSSAMEVYLGLIKVLNNEGELREGGARAISEFYNRMAALWIAKNPKQALYFQKYYLNGDFGKFVNEHIRRELDQNLAFQPSKDWAMADLALLAPKNNLAENMQLASSDTLFGNAWNQDLLIFPGDVFRDGFRVRLLSVQKTFAQMRESSEVLKSLLKFKPFDDLGFSSMDSTDYVVQQIEKSRFMLRAKARREILLIMSSVIALRKFVAFEMQNKFNGPDEFDRLQFIARHKVTPILFELEQEGLRWDLLTKKAGILPAEYFEFAESLSKLRLFSTPLF